MIEAFSSGNDETRAKQPGGRIVGGGAMAELVRRHDWRNTRLGAIEDWSDTLVAAVNLSLTSPLSFALFWGSDLTLIYNDVYRLFLNGKHPQALGQTVREAWKEAWHIVGTSIEAAFTEGSSTHVKNRLIPVEMDGTLKDVYWTYWLNPVYEDGRIAGVSAIAIDVTAEVLAAHRLEQSEKRSSLILQSIGDAVIVTDAEMCVCRMNPIAEKLTGWTIEEARGRRLSEVFTIIDETTRQPIESPADEVRRRGAIVGLTRHALLVARDGRESYIGDSAAPIPDGEGKLSGIVVVFQSVTEHRRAQESLRLSEERLRLAFAAANGVGSWDWDIPKDRVYADAGFCALYGVEPALGISGVAIAAFQRDIHAEDMGQFQDKVLEAMRTGDDYSAEYRIVLPDGSFRWVTAAGRCSLDAEGKPLRFPGVAIDITERKRTEEALRASEERLRIAAETARLGTWELDLASGAIRSSAICKANIGRAADDEYGYADMLASIHAEDRPAVESGIREAAETGRVFRAEFRFFWPDESLHWILVSGRRVPGEVGVPPRVVGVTLNVTERHQAAEALIQSEKLAAVGRLATSIAHEINNPLESVTNLLYLARHSDSAQEIDKYLNLADRELRRVSVITNQTLRFHKQASAPKPVSSTDLFESVLSIHQGRIVNSQIDVQERQRAPQPVNCFDGEIRQVLSNLVGNSIDAMHPNGGRLMLRSREGFNWMTGERGVLMTVADTGGGISPVSMKKLFEPFYTTKGIGGTGLGLWISREIVTRHHGALRVRSSQQQGRRGTVSTLFLPFDAVRR